MLERRKEEKVEKDQKKNNNDFHMKTVIYLMTLFLTLVHKLLITHDEQMFWRRSCITLKETYWFRVGRNRKLEQTLSQDRWSVVKTDRYTNKLSADTYSGLYSFRSFPFPRHKRSLNKDMLDLDPLYDKRLMYATNTGWFNRMDSIVQYITYEIESIDLNHL